MKDIDKRSVINNYEALLDCYGDDPRSVQWRDLETQSKRFKALVEVADLRFSSVLDFGCGKADLYHYLLARGIKLEYSGCDISSKMIDLARCKFPDIFLFCGDISQAQIDKKFDYCLVSGTFNNKLSDNWGFLWESLRVLWKCSLKGIAFNLMSTYVDYEEDDLFYADPKIVFDWVKKNLSRYVVIRHDYMPYEYTFYVYHELRDGQSE